MPYVSSHCKQHYHSLIVNWNSHLTNNHHGNDKRLSIHGQTIVRPSLNVHFSFEISSRKAVHNSGKEPIQSERYSNSMDRRTCVQTLWYRSKLWNTAQLLFTLVLKSLVERLYTIVARSQSNQNAIQTLWIDERVYRRFGIVPNYGIQLNYCLH